MNIDLKIKLHDILAEYGEAFLVEDEPEMMERVMELGAKEIATEYASFCVLRDRQGLPEVSYDNWLKERNRNEEV